MRYFWLILLIFFIGVYVGLVLNDFVEFFVYDNDEENDENF